VRQTDCNLLNRSRALLTFSSMSDAFGGPDERLGIVVVLIDGSMKSFVQPFYAARGTARDLRCLRSRNRRSTMFSQEALVGRSLLLSTSLLTLDSDARILLYSNATVLPFG
jgi:hypothetical protein